MDRKYKGVGAPILRQQRKKKVQRKKKCRKTIMTRNRANQPFLNKFRWRHKDIKKKKFIFIYSMYLREKEPHPY